MENNILTGDEICGDCEHFSTFYSGDGGSGYCF